MKAWLAVFVVALAGCDLYFNGDDDVMCGDIAVAPTQLYRDPYTGTCITIDTGYDCNSCNCPELDTPPPGPRPDYGLCYSSCTDLDEGTCQATPGCYASYDQPDGGPNSATYSGCWQTPISGPIQGSCQNLDAFSCSQHDDCAIVYDAVYHSFQQCIDEPAKTDPSCEATDCGPGYHCDLQCDSAGGPMQCKTACVADDSGCDCSAGYECVKTCETAGDGSLWCGDECVPSGGGDPGTCTGNVTCESPYPVCPSGTTPGIANGCWTGYCIPNADCGPHDPGECYGDLTCTDIGPPACPAGTTAGIANGCWSGYCIPDSACAAAPCETLTTEDACSARMDCSTVYTGTSCTCDANGCTCESIAFARCEDWLL
jgi:hypothetical protein